MPAKTVCDEPVPPAPDRRVAEHGEDAFHRQQCLLLAKEPQLGTTRTSEAAVIVVVHASGEMGGGGGGGSRAMFLGAPVGHFARQWYASK